jgi:nucleotide-binding universal stress UspA family protein
MSITIRRVLAATDFSQSGQCAVDVAAQWARDVGAQLRIIHVTPPKRWLNELWGLGSSGGDNIEAHAAHALKEVATRADPQRTIELSTGVLSGAAARSIAGAARDYEADLIVVGARGERDATGERVLGGTSAKLLATAPAPLLLVRRTRKDPVMGVVAALDLSARSRAVLEWADRAAADRPLYAYHVYDMPFTARLEAYGLAASAIDVYSRQAHAQREAELAALVASIARPGITTYAVERGDPGILVGRYVESVRPSLVVVGKHVKATRSSPASSVGSVCRHVASSVAADVLIV